MNSTSYKFFEFILNISLEICSFGGIAAGFLLLSLSTHLFDAHLAEQLDHIEAQYRALAIALHCLLAFGVGFVESVSFRF